MGAQIHSVPAVTPAEPCEVAVRAAPGRLKPYVLGFSGFRSGSGVPVEHLVLPLAYTTVIVDFGSPSGIVSGARALATTGGDTRWGHGVSLGLTPLGVAALLGIPMRDLEGSTVALADLLGSGATELPGMLGAETNWERRFDLLEAVLDAMLRGPDRGRFEQSGPAVMAAWRLHPPDPAVTKARQLRSPEPVVTTAWRWLQRAGHPPVGVLADQLGVTRRTLERGFRRHIGMSPVTVARIARFQRVVARLGSGAAPSDAAADSGFADHAHLARETRSMAGLTPTELAAFLSVPVSQTFKTGGVRPA